MNYGIVIEKVTQNCITIQSSVSEKLFQDTLDI